MTARPAALLLAAAAALAGTAAAAPPAAPQYRYQASGSGPAWNLVIDPSHIQFSDQSAGVAVTETTPSSRVDSNSETYQTKRLLVTILHHDCNDPTSGQNNGDQVQVTVDGGRQYRGCGGVSVAPRTIAGTSWHIVSVAGRATPLEQRRRPDNSFGEERRRRDHAERQREKQGDPYRIEFRADGKLIARLGCNNLAGRYRADGNRLVPEGPLVATRLACPDMGFETTGSAILAAPADLRLLENERATLTNARGTLELRRSY